jgi:C-terminal processing protease CtpA/Prc
MKSNMTNTKAYAVMGFNFFFFFIIGFDKTDNVVFISEIGPYGSAYHNSNRKLEVGQQIRQINGESLAGKDYSEIVEAIRRTKDTNTVDLFVTDV